MEERVNMHAQDLTDLIGRVSGVMKDASQMRMAGPTTTREEIHNKLVVPLLEALALANKLSYNARPRERFINKDELPWRKDQCLACGGYHNAGLPCKSMDVTCRGEVKLDDKY